MSRVQLALNVSDVDEAVAFYSKLFDAEPAKRKPGYANFAIDEPPLKLVLIESEAGGTLNHLGVEVESGAEVSRGRSPPRRRGPRHHRRRRHDVLLRPQDRDVGERPRRRAVGVVREERRRRADVQPRPRCRRRRACRVLLARGDERVGGGRREPREQRLLLDRSTMIDTTWGVNASAPSSPRMPPHDGPTHRCGSTHRRSGRASRDGHRRPPPRARPAPGRRGAGLRVPDRGRDRLGDHGEPAVARRRGAAAARERRGHRRRADRVDPDLRRRVRCALQPRRHPRRPPARHDSDRRDRPVRPRPDRRCMPRRARSPTPCSSCPSSSCRRRIAPPARCGCPRWSPRSGCCW